MAKIVDTSDGLTPVGKPVRASPPTGVAILAKAAEVVNEFPKTTPSTPQAHSPLEVNKIA